MIKIRIYCFLLWAAVAAIVVGNLSYADTHFSIHYSQSWNHGSYGVQFSSYHPVKVWHPVGARFHMYHAPGAYCHTYGGWDCAYVQCSYYDCAVYPDAYNYDYPCVHYRLRTVAWHRPHYKYNRFARYYYPWPVYISYSSYRWKPYRYRDRSCRPYVATYRPVVKVKKTPKRRTVRKRDWDRRNDREIVRRTTMVKRGEPTRGTRVVNRQEKPRNNDRVNIDQRLKELRRQQTVMRTETNSTRVVNQNERHNRMVTAVARGERQRNNSRSGVKQTHRVQNKNQSTKREQTRVNTVRRQSKERKTTVNRDNKRSTSKSGSRVNSNNKRGSNKSSNIESNSKRGTNKSTTKRVSNSKQKSKNKQAVRKKSGKNQKKSGKSHKNSNSRSQRRTNK